MMKLLKLQWAKNGREALVTPDEGEAVSLLADVVVRGRLHEGLELEAAKWQAILQQDHQERCHLKAMKSIVSRERSRRELELKLGKLGFEKKIIAVVLDRLEELEYLSDERAAKGLVSRSLDSGRGRHRIQQDLIKKGFARELVEGLLKDMESGQDESENILKELARWAKKKSNQAKEPRKQKMAAVSFLARRGFSMERIFPIVEEFFRTRGSHA